MAVSVAAGGCTRRPLLPTDPEGAAEVSSSPPTGASAGVCGLLAVDDVEVALNVALPSLFGQGRPILTGMEMCSLRSGESVAVWGLLADSGVARFRWYRAWNRQEVEATKVKAHDAIWDAGLRTMIVLVGDRAVGIRLSVEHPPLAGGEDRDDYLRSAARRLMASALPRLPDVAP